MPAGKQVSERRAGKLLGMSTSTGLVLLVTVAVICVLLSLLRPRRPRLANRGRRPRGYRWRRIEAMKAAAAADIALIRGEEDRVPSRGAGRTRTRRQGRDLRRT